jgi:hypothetical protein
MWKDAAGMDVLASADTVGSVAWGAVGVARGESTVGIWGLAQR